MQASTILYRVLAKLAEVPQAPQVGTPGVSAPKPVGNVPTWPKLVSKANIPGAPTPGPGRPPRESLPVPTGAYSGQPQVSLPGMEPLQQ